MFHLLRSSLECNKTLGLLSQRYGLHRLYKGISGIDLCKAPDAKCHANLFEAYIGAMSLICGDSAFRNFLNAVFLPILTCAAQTLGIYSYVPRPLPISDGLDDLATEMSGVEDGSGDKPEREKLAFETGCHELGILPHLRVRDTGEQTLDRRFRVTIHCRKELISAGCGPTQHAAQAKAYRNGIATLAQVSG
ncbi:uncharacterized protein EI90DRAFT_105168 [Cantharellus anzutake]|nr:uncharacterized protein EI90DRAFT_105168 [Cantharellus anzutake]KAF8337044.1 hypothetical protein EI90DRAFT_105168 [Cantharellus anzutake]